MTQAWELAKIAVQWAYRNVPHWVVLTMAVMVALVIINRAIVELLLAQKEENDDDAFYW